MLTSFSVDVNNEYHFIRKEKEEKISEDHKTIRMKFICFIIL